MGFEENDLLPRNVQDDASGPHLERMRQDSCVAGPANFHGLDAGIFRFGVTDAGSFTFALDLGPIGHIQPQVGLRNGIDIAVGPPQLGVGLNVEGGINRCGLYAQTDVGANVLGAVGGGVGVDARLGQSAGAGARGYGYVGPVEAAGGGHGYLRQDGMYTGAGAHAGIGSALSAQAAGNFDMNNTDSRLAAGTGVQVGNAAVGLGAGVYSDGNTTVRPDLNGEAVNNNLYGQAHLNWPARQEPVYKVGGSGAPGHAIEVRRLPAPYSPEAYTAFSNSKRQELVDLSSYTVQPGQTSYRDIAKTLVTSSGDEQIVQGCADDLRRLNGPQHLHAGMKISTMKAEDLDLQVRQLTAMHFGMQPPQS